MNRVTCQGQLFDADEGIRPYDALKAYTTDAAYCGLEEDRKGLISPGKLADFIVLADNPLTSDPLGIKDITVLKTYLGGKAVYEVEGAV